MVENHAESTTQSPRLESQRNWAWKIGVSFLLLAIAWIWAEFPPHLEVSILDEDTVRLGYNVLLMLAIPWLLQWAAVVLLLTTVCRRLWNVDRGPIIFATCWTLLVGTMWWTALFVRACQNSPLEWLIEIVAEEVSFNLGGGSVGYHLVFRVLGPLVHPLGSSGPGAMAGWEFLWTGLSTTLVTAYWIGAASWIGFSTRLWGFPTRGELLRLVAAILLYMVPSYLHLANRIIERRELFAP